jgi:MSHA biogenesis protein MshK
MLACSGLVTVSASAGTLVDPTAPARAAVRAPAPGTMEATAPPVVVLRLHGVWQRGTDRVAIVNGTRVRAGDRVDGARVLAVLDDRVQVRGADGRTETLRLQPRIRSAATEFVPADAAGLAVRP